MALLRNNRARTLITGVRYLYFGILSTDIQLFFFGANTAILLAMALAQRIKQRLQELGLSQAELARRAKIPQTTVNGLLQGKSRSTPHLLRIARELQTSPAYLMGETEDPQHHLPEFHLSQEEQKWLEMYRGLDAKDKAAITQLLRTLAS